MPKNQVAGLECGSGATQTPSFSAHPTRETRLGNLSIARALPIRQRRMVGPWCFLDRFGPLAFKDEKPMAVPQHPHIGLQTVSWLLEGEVQHTDSLGQEATISPGGVNVMTAGKGIAHAEETPISNSGRLSGVQLWVALPDAHRHTDPFFTSIEQVPILENKGGIIQIFAGSLLGFTSPVRHFSDILGVELEIHPHQTIHIPLDPRFEHAAFSLDGDLSIEDQPIEQKTLYYLGPCRDEISFASRMGGKALLIGGTPFPEKILMWWNFVARSPEEIRQARDDWEAQRRFGDVSGTQLGRLAAPELSRFARANPIS